MDDYLQVGLIDSNFNGHSGLQIKSNSRFFKEQLLLKMFRVQAQPQKVPKQRTHTGDGPNWMDFHNRQYDPQIGRFLQVDPLAAATDMMSTYVAMNNDPVLNVDPLGLASYMSTPGNEAFARSVIDYYAAVGLAAMGDVRDPSFRIVPVIYGTGGSGGQITLYGAEAQAAWATISGQTNTPNKVAAFSGNLVKEASQLTLSGGGGNIFNGENDYYQLGEGAGIITFEHIASTYKYNLIPFSNESDGFNSYSGVTMSMVYTGNVSGYQATGWIQTVITDNPGRNRIANVRFNDFDITDGGKKYANPPFYHATDEIDAVKRIGKANGGLIIQDRPSRESTPKSYYWRAETSLVGLKNGIWQNIMTFTWGFTSNNGKSAIVPLQANTKPGYYQQFLIHSLNMKP